jgi:hypothetical protein
LKRDAADPGVGYNGFNASGLKFIVAWAPGGGTLTLPPDLAWKFPKGANLVLQTHLHPSGKVEQEATTVRLRFAKKPPEKNYTTINIPPNFGTLKDIYIPAGQSNFVMRDSFVLPVDGEAFAVGGHAHEIGRSLQMTATFPDGSQRVLLRISDWDFAWQEQYEYRERIRLPKGTKLETVVTWDNSAANPRNPHTPPRDISWGEQTTNEMGSVVLAFIPAKQDDFPVLRAALEDHVADQVIDLGLAPEAAFRCRSEWAVGERGTHGHARHDQSHRTGAGHSRRLALGCIAAFSLHRFSGTNRTSSFLAPSASPSYRKSRHSQEVFW